MKLDLKFKENNQRLDLGFGQFQDLTDGGYERGYAAGKEDGRSEGYAKGHTDGQTDGLESLFLKTIKRFSSNEVVSVEAATFFNCAELEELNIPNLASIPNSMCQNCVKLKKVIFPKLTGVVGISAFNGCKGLEYADIGAAANVGAAGFYMCAALSTLIIRTASVIPMVNSNAIYGTLIANKAGYIYVPDNLVDKYKAATNWSTHAAQIKPLSELGE